MDPKKLVGVWTQACDMHFWLQRGLVKCHTSKTWISLLPSTPNASSFKTFYVKGCGLRACNFMRSGCCKKAAQQGEKCILPLCELSEYEADKKIKPNNCKRLFTVTALAFPLSHKKNSLACTTFCRLLFSRSPTSLVLRRLTRFIQTQTSRLDSQFSISSQPWWIFHLH